MGEKQISTGEAAKISGLTIRTLQHYDNIGVLPASGRTEGGRRFYTESDMVKLEHVVFYRGLGFSLEQIKERLLDTEIGENANELLSLQKTLLYNQVYSIQNSIAAIEASQEIIGVGKTPPWTLLATFMQSLGAVDISIWADYEFTEEQIDVFKEHFQAFDDVMDFYNTWKRLSIKAAAFCEAGIMPGETIAQKLATEWAEMEQKATGGKDEHEQAYLAVDSRRDMWSSAERELIEKAEPFLDEAVKIYRQKQK
ncbi:MAG: MerR family transcriptional regulator [Oscillospiraceae bacterium]|jgi:DNA-binding transcriptional MerR regulator|nr:MerR family transcriptional regulator [Oscillospiraceae bacterium]